MPLNEASGKPKRERWPIEFDLEGIPRDKAIRKRRLEAMKKEAMNNPTNKFAGDVVAALSETQKNDLLDLLLKTAPVGREIDLGKPVHVNYRHQEYPRMVYKGGSIMTVADEKQLKLAMKRGFELKPHPDYDYSKLNRANVAPLAETGPARDEALSAEDLEALEEED